MEWILLVRIFWFHSMRKLGTGFVSEVWEHIHTALNQTLMECLQLRKLSHCHIKIDLVKENSSNRFDVYDFQN